MKGSFQAGQRKFSISGEGNTKTNFKYYYKELSLKPKVGCEKWYWCCFLDVGSRPPRAFDLIF